MTTNKHGDHDQHVREPPHRASQYLQPPIASKPAWNKGKHASQALADAAQSPSLSFAGEPRQLPHRCLQTDGAGGVEAQGDVRTGSVGAPGQSCGAGRLTIGMGVGPDAGLPAWPRQLGEPLGVELDLHLPLAAAQS